MQFRKHKPAQGLLPHANFVFIFQLDDELDEDILLGGDDEDEDDEEDDRSWRR